MPPEPAAPGSGLGPELSRAVDYAARDAARPVAAFGALCAIVSAVRRSDGFVPLSAISFEKLEAHGITRGQFRAAVSELQRLGTWRREGSGASAGYRVHPQIAAEILAARRADLRGTLRLLAGGKSDA